MTTLPINLVVFTSTAGHFGFYDVYKTSVKHLKKQIGLNTFSQKFAHIKVREDQSEKDRLNEMVDFFVSENIKPIVTFGNWQRGMSHQNEYLNDIYKMFTMQDLHNQPFTFWFEDDSPLHAKDENSVFKCFNEAIDALNNNIDLLNFRFIRDGLVEPEKSVSPYNQMETFDFQPNISRTRDLFLAIKIIFDNWKSFKNAQCEMAFRIAISNFSRSNPKFLGFDTKIATSYHIGTPEYLDYLKLDDFQNL